MKWMLISIALGFASSATSGDIGTMMRQSAPKGISESFFQCSDRAGDNVSALGECVSAEKRIQDGLLNRNYAGLMSKLQGKVKDDLRASERAWIEFNAKTVDVELAMRGTDQTANIEAAISELYRYASRADDLRKMAFVTGNKDL
jgi:uncharacterized protein YecT (DUF1311 family)